MEDLRKTLKLNLKFNAERCEVCDWCRKKKVKESLKKYLVEKKV